MTIRKVSVDKIGLKFCRKAMLKRVYTSMRDGSVTCLKSKKLEKAGIIFWCARVEWCNKA